MTLIAVYGSLRKLGPNNHLLNGCEFLCEDYVPGKIYGTLAFFPAAKLHDSPDDGLIKVEVYDVQCTGTLMALDRYEGFYPKDPDSSLFVPKETETVGGHKVLIYEANFDVNESLLVKDGDWFSKMG